MPGPMLWGPSNTAQSLEGGVKLGALGSTVLSGAVDPSAVATLGNIGSLYLNTSSGLIYRKTDNGTTTNWSSLPTSIAVDPTTTVTISDDFSWGNQANTPTGPFGLVATGSSGGGILIPANTIAPILNRWGVIGFALGTTANATANGFWYSDYALAYPGQTLLTTLQFSINTPAALSDATNEYVLDFGFRDSFNTNAQAANAMSICYNRTISTNWMAYTANNSTVTNVTTANAALAVTTSTWWNFKITIASGTVSFYAALPGAAFTLIGTSTTNLPDNTHRAFMTGMIYKAANFALQRIVATDYVKLDMTFNTAR